MKTITKGNLEDYIIGSTILSCGGGGTAEAGRAIIEDAFERGFKFNLADSNELPDDAFLCILGRVGGGVPKEILDKVAPYFEKFKSRRDEPLHGLQAASRRLSDFLGTEFHSYIATETGPVNGILAMYMAASEGKPCVDGDCCGRAKPEIAISLTNVAGIPITPLSIITPFGETMILENAVDDDRAEDLSRHAAIASGGWVYVARSPAKVALYRKGMAPGQVTKCIEVGEAIRIAREKSEDLAAAFRAKTNAEKLFEGTVSSHNIEGRGGFNWGEWQIEGTGEFKGHSFRIWFKNEHLISWLDGEPHAVCPDLICTVDVSTGEGPSNFVESGEHNGKNIAVFRLKALEAWRTKKGLELFGPAHFGFDIEYR